MLMSWTPSCKVTSDQGFSLVEVLVALVITLIVMSAVFGLLVRGQRGFQREPEIADMNQNTRFGLDMISRDLAMAGYRTPPDIAVRWSDGGGTTPDELTIVYSDPFVPTSWALPEKDKGGGPANTIYQSSTLWVDPGSFEPPQANPEIPYQDGMTLLVLESGDCDGDQNFGMVLFELSKPPQLQDNSGKLQLQHNPGKGSEINLPGGFNREVTPECAVIGMFTVIQYRINPLPPTSNPVLERRLVGLEDDWIPVANNIEDFQVQYSIGDSTNWVAEPPMLPDQDDPTTWITQVRLTLRGRTESTNFEGATLEGASSPEEAYVRETYSTTVTLRNLAN
jgi:prepilin-type N-terminal cleavage/methylation domain-containing protein